MMESESSQRKRCVPHSPLCTTAGFGMGLLLGALLLNNHSPIAVVISVVVATIGFHYTFATSPELQKVITKVIKKGS